MNLYNFFWTSNSIKRNLITEKYEPVQPFLFLSIINKLRCEVVFDIGSNVGFYALLSSLSKTVKMVHAFEAIEEPFLELINNIEMNGLQSIILPNNLAASDKDEEIKFLVNRDPLSGTNASEDTTFHDKRQYISQRAVSAISIDNHYNTKHKVLGFKIDVEGHELSVIDGCAQTLRDNKCALQIECFPRNLDALSTKMEKLGYTLFYKLHNDLYFTNEKDLVGSDSVNSLVGTSLNLLIENKLGNYPDRPAPTNFVTGSCSVIEGGKLDATLSVDKNTFPGDVEYAFYLMIDRKKSAIIWYTSDNTVQFDVPEGVDPGRVFVRGFVRNKRLPDKKIYIDLNPEID
ncbi:FkbM family methyltransferase [Yunchengibacter salinarum]|uniref:FkbM family methyltransferase n=1 Tax=Yunchengibacter salinarum TaxID=3133399 RepID=UPI0035B6164A